MNEPDQLPPRDQARLPCKDRLEERKVPLRRSQLRVVPCDGVIRKRPQCFVIVVCRRPLHGADADMARRDSREHCSVEHRFPIHGLAGRRDRQAARGRNSKRVHRLADDVFPQHRTERGAAVAAAREACRPCPFQLNVDAIAGWRDLLAQQDRASVAERGEVAELMTGVCLRDRPRRLPGSRSRRKLPRLQVRRAPRLQAKHRCQRPVERNQARLADRSRHRIRVEELRQLCVSVLEGPACHTTIIAAGCYDFAFFDPFDLPEVLRSTASRTSALKADASTSSPSWISIARRTFPSRLELKRPAGSFNDAPLANVSLTTLLYDSPVQMIPPCDQTGVPGLVGLTHFHSSTTSGSACLMSVTHPGEGLPAPVSEFGDSFRDQLRC